MPDILSKFQKDPYVTFRVILLTHRQTDKQTKSDKNITSLSEVINKFVHVVLDRSQGSVFVRPRCVFTVAVFAPFTTSTNRAFTRSIKRPALARVF